MPDFAPSQRDVLLAGGTHIALTSHLLVELFKPPHPSYDRNVVMQERRLRDARDLLKDAKACLRSPAPRSPYATAFAQISWQSCSDMSPQTEVLDILDSALASLERCIVLAKDGRPLRIDALDAARTFIFFQALHREGQSVIAAATSDESETFSRLLSRVFRRRSKGGDDLGLR